MVVHRIASKAIIHDKAANVQAFAIAEDSKNFQPKL